MSGEAADRASNPPRKLRLLYVEDSALDAELCLRDLKRAGFDLSTDIVATREAFLEKLRAHHYDVILSDYNLANWSGVEALEILKQEAIDTPFILVTGSLGDEAAVDCIRRGVTDYVLKDRSARLPASIHRALAEKKLREEGRRAAKALEESEIKYRLLFQSNPQPMWVYDLETLRFLEVNDAAVAHYGYLRDEFLNMTLKDIRPADDVPLLLKSVSGFRRGLEVSGTWRHQKKDRTPIDVEIVSHSIEFERREAVLVLALDITERKQLELQLRQSQKMEAIGQLAGGVAHDFNNLLTIIRGYCELLMEGLTPESRQLMQAAEIQKAADRAASLTRQLLAFGRRQVLAPQVLDLNTIVANMRNMLCRLIGEDIELVAVLGEGLGRVKADSGQIEQVIMNLAVNARDAMPRGGKLTIETSDVFLSEAYAHRHIAVTSGHHVCLAVSDTGCGMDEATQARVFEPFFTTKEKGKGTGLGLATVYGIVKQSGGNIWLYSEPGRGSTFKVYFPRVEENASAPLANEAHPSFERGTETILLVEDEESLRTLVRGILEPNGFTILDARGGDEALEISQRHAGPIHMVLTDVVMPQMSGPELAARVSLKRPKIRTLFMSGYTNNAICTHGILEDGLAFIEKPFTPRALVRKIREVLDAPRQPKDKAA